MRKTCCSIFRTTALLLIILVGRPAYAVGTAATTPISNTATVNYTVNAASLSASDTVVLTVQEYIDFTVSWQDAANVVVATPSTEQVLSYQVINTGNGTEEFSLSVFNADITDQFDPVNARIYFDEGNGSWDGATVETLYVPGVNDPILDANGIDRIQLYVVNDIPAALTIGDLGNSRLDVTVNTAGASGAAAGTVLNAAGDSGVNAVIGASQAQASVTGTYEVNSIGAVAVGLSKSSAVINNLEGCIAAPCDPNPGATIRYTIAVNVSGTGTAESLVITDVVPANTTYVNESVTLENIPKSDAVDTDEVQFSAGTVSVNLGDVVSPATYTITFDVIIN